MTSTLLCKKGILFSDEISTKLKAISTSVFHSVFGRVTKSGTGAVEPWAIHCSSREMDFPSLMKPDCMFVVSWHSVLLYLCDQQVPRAVTTFSLMWLPCFAAWCLPWTGSVATREKEGVYCVKGSLPCLQKGAEPTLKTCRLYIHLLSHAERKAEQLRRPKSYSLEKLQSRVVALVTSPKDWAGEANQSKPSCEWAATLCFALVHEGVGFSEGASGVSLTLAVRWSPSFRVLFPHIKI